MKSIYLSHTTAQWYWSHAPHADALARAAKRTGLLANAAACQTDILGALENSIFNERFYGQKLHVIIDAPNRSHAAKIAFHFSKQTFPSAAFVRLAGQVYVASPELCFLQAAQERTFIETIQYGCNLCGTFIYDEAAEDGLAPRSAVTSKKKIAQFLDKCTGQKGLKRARAALAFVLDGSASPRETKGALILSLPARYGGYGLYGLLLNQRIDIPPSKKYLINKDYLVADYLWEGTHITAEYDSDAHHAKKANYVSDKIRGNALPVLGYYSCAITTAQLDNMRECDRVAEIIRKKLKRKPQKRPADFEDRKRDLRRELCLP